MVLNPEKIPGKSRPRKNLGNSARFKPVSFLPRFMLGNEISSTTWRNFVPGYTRFLNPEEFPGKSRPRENLRRSAGF